MIHVIRALDDSHHPADMRNPHGGAEDWSKPDSTKAVGSAVCVPGGANKKFKRKSRQPKRLYSSALDDSAEDFQPDPLLEEENHEELCGLGQHQAPVPKHSAATDGKQPVPSSQNDALDMRIGHHVPAITAKLSQSAVCQLPHLRTSRWFTSVSHHHNGNTFVPALGFPALNTSTNPSHDPAPITHPPPPPPHPQDRSLPAHLSGSGGPERGDRAVIVPVSSGAYRTDGHSSDSQDTSPQVRTDEGLRATRASGLEFHEI